MVKDRTFSTREVAQMWNVSESTVKRWSDCFGLRCSKTPGGHRRFCLEDISEFQRRRAFEATGLLSTEGWEDPEMEVWLNGRKFNQVRDSLLFLASQNQRAKVQRLLERLYLRGMGIDEIYQEILSPLFLSIDKLGDKQHLSSGQVLLVHKNLEEALTKLFPNITRKGPNGKTALCCAPTHCSRIPVAVLSQMLELEGWEVLSLGDGVPFKVMSEIVELEPINLVCLFFGPGWARMEREDPSPLNRVIRQFGISVIQATPQQLTDSESTGVATDAEFTDFRMLKKYAARLAS